MAQLPATPTTVVVGTGAATAKPVQGKSHHAQVASIPPRPRGSVLAQQSSKQLASHHDDEDDDEEYNDDLIKEKKEEMQAMKQYVKKQKQKSTGQAGATKVKTKAKAGRSKEEMKKLKK